MDIRKSAIIILSLASLFLCQSQPARAQKALIDTSNYLPGFVSGALEYNLILAAEKGYAGEVERLIKRGAETDAVTDEGATPLIFAVANKRSEAAKVLLYYGADPDHVTNLSETPLLIAVKNQDEIITEVLIRYGANLEYRDQYSCTPLHYASVYGYLRMADILLYYDADIESKSADGTTPLMAAIWSGFYDVAGLLIDRGANMEAADNKGFTPFLIAAQNGDTAMMRVLKEKGVDIFETNTSGYGAMDLAIKTDQPHVIDLLVKWDTRWIVSYPGRVNPYEIAARYRRSGIISVLEKYGFPEKYKPRPENLELTFAPLTNFRDFYSGFSLAFTEPLHGIGLALGIDTKLWYTRGYIKESDVFYYQYMDKSSFAYAGLYKNIALTNNIFAPNVYISAGLKGGYYFANEFRGTNINPGGKIKVMPSLGFKWISEKIIINLSAEYLDTGFDRMSPVWCRIGVGYNLQFNKIKIDPKIIKWY